MALCTASESNICDLGEDLLMNILSRLPPKPLFICKCVSKKFRLLVSTLIHSQTRAGLLSGVFVSTIYVPYPWNHQAFECIHWGDEDHEMETDIRICSLSHQYHYVDIMHSCGGLLLCYANNLGEPSKLYVCNPLTQQLVALPKLPDRYGIGISQLALVPYDSPDDASSHYKVVQFLTVDYENLKNAGYDYFKNLYVSVYSSKTGQWAESKTCIKGIINDLMRYPVFSNGCVFLHANPFQILLFDVEEEYCKMLDLPKDSPNYGGIPWYRPSNCLGESQGCLNFAFHNGSVMEVWMMIDGSGNWILKHSINLDDIEFPAPSADYAEEGEPLHIVAFHPNLDAIFLKNLGDFFSYDFNSGALETIMRCPKWAAAEAVFVVFPFSKCLRSLPNAQRRI